MKGFETSDAFQRAEQAREAYARAVEAVAEELGPIQPVQRVAVAEVAAAGIAAVFGADAGAVARDLVDATIGF